MKHCRAGAALFCALLIGITLMGAGDPWKEKPWREWDEKDLAQIMGDSPWTRPVKVEATWRTARSAPRPAAQEARGENVRMSTPTTTEPRKAGDRGPLSGSEPGVREENGAAQSSQASFTVRWASSRALRQAVARMNTMSGAPVEEMEKLIAVRPPNHEIVIFGPDMTPFTPLQPDELREGTKLILKSSKKELPPATVSLNRSPDAARIVSVVFVFPEKDQAGSPLITGAEKSIEFRCQAGKTLLRVNFEPHKMVTRDGAEFRP